MFNKSNGTLISSEALLALLSPAIAYLLAFRYELGSFSYWGIPRDFVSINLTTVFTAWVAILAAALFFLLIINVVLSPVLNAKQSNRAIAIYATWAVFFILPPIIIYGRNWHEWIASFLINGSLVVFYVAFALFTQRNVKGVAAKLEAAEEADSRFPTVTQRIFDTAGKNFNFVFLLTLVGYLHSYDIGKKAAMSQTEYLYDVKSCSVVLRLYEDWAIIATMDSTLSFYYPEFSVLPIPNANLNLLLSERIPIRPHSDLSDEPAVANDAIDSAAASESQHSEKSKW